jgi:hypothetical protein
MVGRPNDESTLLSLAAELEAEGRGIPMPENGHTVPAALG